MKEFTIGQNDAGQRLDKFLGKAAPLLPASTMYKGIRTKRIKVNGKRAEISTRLTVGDVVSLYLNDEFFAEQRADTAFLRAGDALSVIYEDGNILIADKPAGLVVHEDESGTADRSLGGYRSTCTKRASTIRHRKTALRPRCATVSTETPADWCFVPKMPWLCRR